MTKRIGVLVPAGNPDRLESGFATKWLRYSIAGADTLPPERWQSVHGGFNTSRINEDPHRVVPLDVARELEREGAFGKLADFYCATTGNDQRLLDCRRNGAEIAATLAAERAGGVLLVAT